MKILIATLLLAASGAAFAHKPSDSTLNLAVDGATLSGRWDVALRDLEYAVGLDVDGDGALTWGEVKTRHRELTAYALSRLSIAADGDACALEVAGLAISEHSDGRYVALALRGNCARAPDTLHVGYRLLFELDPTHRGLVRLRFGEEQLTVFAPESAEQSFTRGERGAWRAFVQHLREGALHVWTGLDHVLFLAALLLPAVLRREGARWAVAQDGRAALVEIVVVVTAFTLAHATTLTLVLLDEITLPSRWVESLVALTVAFAAFNNLQPLVRRRLWRLSFGFGLIHGAAIASTLAALDLARGNLALALLGFNLGVEAGQLAIVALWLPLAFALRRQAWYQWGVVGLGSLAVLLIALVWLAERALGLTLL